MEITINDPEIIDALKNAVEYEEKYAPYKCRQCNADKPEDADVVEWKCSCGYENRFLGWEWSNVTNNSSIISKLLRINLIEVVYRSNRYTCYALTNDKLVRKLISLKRRRILYLQIQ